MFKQFKTNFVYIIAVFHGRNEIVAFLASKRALLNEKNKYNKTALELGIIIFKVYKNLGLYFKIFKQ